MCYLSKQYQQIKIIQDQNLGLTKIKLGDLLVAMRRILRPYSPATSIVEYYLTPAQLEETQNEFTNFLNTLLQNIINDTDITWALDDAVDIFMTTGSEIIKGNLKQFLM